MFREACNIVLGVEMGLVGRRGGVLLSRGASVRLGAARSGVMNRVYCTTSGL